MFVGKVTSIGDGDGDDESPSPPTAPEHKGPTPHSRSDVSLPSRGAPSPSRILADLPSALVRPSSTAPVPLMPREFDISTPLSRCQGPESTPESLLPRSGSSSGSSAPPAECGDLELERERSHLLELEHERRRSNLLELERERTRMRLLELEQQRTRMALLELERERTRIYLIDQQTTEVAYALRPDVQAMFASPVAGGQRPNWDVVGLAYGAGGANAQHRLSPADLSQRSLSEVWTRGFRSGLGSVA